MVITALRWHRLTQHKFLLHKCWFQSKWWLCFHHNRTHRNSYGWTIRWKHYGRFSVLSLIYSTWGPRAFQQNHEALRAYKMQNTQGAAPVCNMLSAHSKQLEKSSPVLSSAFFLASKKSEKRNTMQNKKITLQYSKRNYLINSVCLRFHELEYDFLRFWYSWPVRSTGGFTALYREYRVYSCIWILAEVHNFIEWLLLLQNSYKMKKLSKAWTR